MELSTVFATWFGSESILGAGSKLAEGGFRNVIVGIIALGSIFLAYNLDAHIYELVAGAYSVTLVAGFVPLAFSLYAPWVNSFGALISILSGIIFWQIAVSLRTDIPATFIGFFCFG